MKIKRNKKSYKWFLCGLILVVVLTISYRVSKANYRISNSIELTTGKVISNPYDFNIVSMYIDGVEQSKDTTIPDDSYIIDETNSYCYKEDKNNKDTNVKLYTNELGNHVFEDISKGSKCILYFKKIETSISDKCGNACKYILSKVDGIKSRRRTYKPFNVPFGDVNNYIYKAPDGDSISYYFAGNPSNNWVEFGEYYWRIIRINGDGTIRMIYQGRAKDENGNKLEPQATGKETQIAGTYKFNNFYDNNMYVGYFYEQGQVHGLKEPSSAYTTLNNWFENSNIKQGTSYFNLIDENVGFCGDRIPYTDVSGNTSGGGTEITETHYGAFVRLLPGNSIPTSASTAVEPTFNCAHNDDLYTYSGAKENMGNRKLANPVGIITADEVSYAGIVYGVFSSGNYLDTASDYWTMSPFWYRNNTHCFMFYVHHNDYLASSWANNTFGIRPVINLRSDVTFTGNGTIFSPYVVLNS